MNEKRTNLEVIAPSVEEAIARGLSDLGLPEEAVDIEVLDTGTRGLFGLGTRQARVRLSMKSLSQEKSLPVSEPEDNPTAATKVETISVQPDVKIEDGQGELDEYLEDEVQPAMFLLISPGLLVRWETSRRTV